MQSNNIIIRLEDIAFAYGASTIISGCNLSIPAGKITVLLGANGCGKSTLLNICAGVLPVTSGTLHYLPNTMMDYAPQNHVLLPWLTVEQNITLPRTLNPQRVSKLFDITSLLTRYGLDAARCNTPHSLSGGMVQKACFIRALTSGANLLLLDEAMSQMDIATRRLAHEDLDVFCTQGGSVVMVLHDVIEAMMLADTVYILSPQRGIVAHHITLHTPRKARTPQHNEVQHAILDVTRFMV